MRIEEVKQQFLVGWLGSRLLIDLQVTAGVRGPRPGCHSLALLHPRTTPPLLIFALSLSLSRQCILSSHLCQLISHLLPSPLIQPLALSLFFSLSLCSSSSFCSAGLFTPSVVTVGFSTALLYPPALPFLFSHCWEPNAKHYPFHTNYLPCKMCSRAGL